MATVQDTTRANTPTGTSTANPQDTRHKEEERQRTQGLGAQVRDHAQETGAKMRDAADDIGTHMRDKVQELSTQAQQLGTQVQETASEYYEQGRETLQEWNQSLEAQIRQKPLQSLLVVGGIGFLLGLLWRRH